MELFGRSGAKPAVQQNSGGANVLNYQGSVDNISIGAVGISSAPFVPIEHADVYGAGDSASVALRREEYAKPDFQLKTHNLVAEALTNHQAVRVVGASGTGKTTLAVGVGLNSKAVDSCFYVDFAEMSTPLAAVDRALILEQISKLKTPHSLFILDNTHVDLRTERAVLQHWLMEGAEGGLIILSRRGNDVTDTRIVNIHLEITEESVFAVCTRALANSGATWEIPPGTVLREWRDTFADLLALTLAVRSSSGRLKAGRTTLSEQDAVDWVQSRYLNGRSAEWRRGVLRIAAVGEYEFGLGAASLDIATLDGLLKEGLVQAKKTHYKLDHPATARLLLRAFSAMDRAEVLTEISGTEPYVVAGIAAMLKKSGRHNEAVEVAGRLLTKDGQLSAAVIRSFWLPNLVRQARQLVELGVTKSSTLDAQLLAMQADLVKMAHKSPPFDLITFLHARDILPETTAALGLLLRHPSVRAHFLDWALDGSLLALLSLAHATERVDRELGQQLFEIWFNTRRTEVLDLAPTLPQSIINDCLNIGPKLAPDFIDALFDRLGSSMEEIARIALARTGQDIALYDRMLESQRPDLAASFRRHLAGSRLNDNFNLLLNVASISSLVPLLEWAVPVMPQVFSDRIVNVLVGKLGAEDVSSAFTEIEPGELKKLVMIAKLIPELGATIPEVSNLLNRHAVNIGYASLRRSLSRFVALLAVLDNSFGTELADRYRSIATNELIELTAEQWRHANEPTRKAARGWIGLSDIG